jgi:hypothetical protein
MRPWRRMVASSGSLHFAPRACGLRLGLLEVPDTSQAVPRVIERTLWGRSFRRLNVPLGMATDYQPPKDLWQVSEQLKYDEPLRAGDPRWVDTAPGRNLGYARLFKSLGVDPATMTLRVAHLRQYNLLCGHRGSGKSTELRRIASELHSPKLFHVVFMDVLEDLDINNLQYPDVCLAIARRLFDELQTAGIKLDPVFLRPLETWFQERVLVSEKFRGVKAELEAGAEAELGVPFLSKLFAKFTTTFQTGSNLTEEVRTVFKSAFSEFAREFNLLLAHVQARLLASGKGHQILFIVDGTDRLDDQDSRQFFFENVHQLQQLDGIFLYCAPIHLILTANAAQPFFNHIAKIPSLKLNEKFDPSSPVRPPRQESTYGVLRQLVLKRAPARLFAPDPEATGDWSTVDALIEATGGHLRDLLRTLDYAFEHATGDRFDLPSVQAAIRALASDYRRFLQPDDFRVLVEIDHRGADYCPTNEQTRSLLFNLALLEYNDFWWQSHPVVRTLPAYQEALKISLSLD